MPAQRKTPSAEEQPGATIVLSKQRQFTFSPLVRQVAGGLLLLAIVATGASVANRTCRTTRGTIDQAPVNMALVLKNTSSEAVAAPTDKRGFVTSYSLAGAGVSSSSQHCLGRDGAIRKDARTASDVFLTSRPPYALKNANGGFLHVPEGA